MTTRALESIAELTGENIEQLENIHARYPINVPQFLLERINAGDYSKEAARQFLPDAIELVESASSRVDPCNERKYMVNEAVINRYGNRAAIFTTARCLVYCRFCFRKDLVGHAGNEPKDHELEAGLSYIESNSEVVDVLLTGGDPLALPNRKLIPLLERLVNISHVKVIRLDSRSLNASPRRFDADLLGFLKKSKKIWYHAHLNHPDDLNHVEVIQVCDSLVESGIPILNQCVLLKGVNDDVDIIKRLMMISYQHRIIPYNLYMPDNALGTDHFQVPLDSVEKIFYALADLPGPAQPAFVVVDGTNRKQRIVPSPHADLKGFIARHKSLG